MNTISDVLARLTAIIEWAKANNSPLGYFAVVYHLMTEAVQSGIKNGTFEDGPRMERLDVFFAQRYFDAFDAWQAGQPTTRSWEQAFRAADKANLTVLQHILLGINAHIDLDLGVAAGQTNPGEKILDLERDFNRINEVIAGLVNPVQDRLSQVCPLLWVVDKVLSDRDEHLSNKLIGLGRESAWTVATSIAYLDDGLHVHAIERLDTGVATLAQPIASPPSKWLRAGMRLVRLSEWGSVTQKIEKLQGRLLWTDELEGLLLSPR
ncbi:MAG: DUF5995 family protein [Saprospiraceae bacterium]